MEPGRDGTETVLLFILYVWIGLSSRLYNEPSVRGILDIVLIKINFVTDENCKDRIDYTQEDADDLSRYNPKSFAGVLLE